MRKGIDSSIRSSVTVSGYIKKRTKIFRLLLILKSFIGKRKDFVINKFTDLKPVERFETGEM